MPDKLTALERSRFAICKKTISDGLQTCFDTGAALIEIRDKEYYREEFKTFEEFCSQTYQIGRSQAYRLIDAAEVKESLPKSAAKLLTNESQARALSDVPEDRRAEVILEVKKSGEPITAEAIREAAPKPKMSPIGDKDHTVKMGKSDNGPSKNGPVKRVTELDEVGTPIPEDAIPFWHRKQEIQDLLTQISHIKKTIERHRNESDPMFAKVSNGAVDQLALVYQQVLEAKPYAVCTTCMGRFTVQPKGCSFCGNKGLISKWQWDTQSRKEVKEMRLKSNSARVAA